MEVCLSYESYLNCLIEIVEQLGNEAASQGTNAQNERNTVSEIENKYMQYSEELQQAKKIVQDQYGSVWESCTQHTGLKRPCDQRPAPTDLSWKEAVRIQEQAASKISDWFTLKSQQAVIDRQNKIREEAAKKAAIAAAQAEAARKRAEEEAQAERECGEALIEAMKRKHRGKN